MPKADYNIFNVEEVVIIGWGQYRQEGDDFVIPDRLQKALVPVIDYVTCTDVLEGHWPGFYEIDFMNENNFCTGPINGNINVCTHDSGGPVLQPSEFGIVANWCNFMGWKSMRINRCVRTCFYGSLS